jgi:hypothetical protein
MGLEWEVFAGLAGLALAVRMDHVATPITSRVGDSPARSYYWAGQLKNTAYSAAGVGMGVKHKGPGTHKTP